MKKNLIFYFIIFICLKTTVSEIIEKLQKECPSYTELLASLNQTKDTLIKQNSFKTLADIPEYPSIQNIETLANYLFNGVEKIGQGSFGKIYPFVHYDMINKQDENVVAKVLRVPNDKTQSEDSKIQNMLYNEIKANQIVYNAEHGSNHFPKILGCFDITGVVDTWMTLMPDYVSNETQRENVEHEANQAMFTVFTEKMDFSLSVLMDLLKEGKITTKAQDRMDMLKAALQGLEIMNSYFLHCDIKPSNIMLKNLSNPELHQLHLKKQAVISLTDTQFVQLKYIDFGMVSFGEENERFCEGGTPGFVPDEFLMKKKVTHEKFDVYSLGMSFLDLELAIEKLHGLSFVDKLLFNIKKRGKKKLEKAHLQLLNKHDLIQTLKSTIFTTKYREMFLTRMRETFPEFESYAQQIFGVRDYMRMDPLKYLETDVYTFRQMILTSIWVYFNHHYVEELVSTDEIDRQIALLDQETDTKSENSGDENDEFGYLNNKKKMIRAEAEVRVELVNLFLSMITRKTEQRPCLKSVQEQLLQIKVAFLKEFNKTMDDIFLHENELIESLTIPSIDLESFSNDIMRKIKDKAKMQMQMELHESLIGHHNSHYSKLLYKNKTMFLLI